MNRKPIQLMLAAAIVLLLASIAIDRCDKPLRSGIFKDADTGLSTTYTGLVPDNTVLVMNDEIIRHTDIPLGETFMLIHENVKGLQEKEGKISIGCALRIADTAGHILMDEADLFADTPPLDKKDARMLRCTINTGAPMQWDTPYRITVSFWDKFGNGRIDNQFSIITIDIP